MMSILAAAVLAFAQPASDDIRPIMWTDLLPEGQEASLPPAGPGVDHNSAGAGPGQQTGSTEAVMELDGVKISMPGFMLPLDYTEKGRVSAFLLVPYYGACIHVPPPPPNQIVYVETKDSPVESRGLWDPVTVTGTMTVQMNINGLGDAAYTLLLDKVEPYQR